MAISVIRGFQVAVNGILRISDREIYGERDRDYAIVYTADLNGDGIA